VLPVAWCCYYCHIVCVQPAEEEEEEQVWGHREVAVSSNAGSWACCSVLALTHRLLNENKCSERCCAADTVAQALQSKHNKLNIFLNGDCTSIQHNAKTYPL
jgi:hypothetical protein